MELSIRIKMNEKLYLRDPESSALGLRIVAEAVLMIEKIGFEQFTFKKLAEAVNTTEASIYRYFENKHRLLVYITTWYWAWVEYQVMFRLNNMKDPEEKVKAVIDLLTNPVAVNTGNGLDIKALFNVVVWEIDKIHHTKDVNINNRHQLFKPYKDLCARIAQLFVDYNPKYPYPRSLASTLLEMTHMQYFFMQHLPSLTDFGNAKNVTELNKFLESLVFSSLKTKKL